MTSERAAYGPLPLLAVPASRGIPPVPPKALLGVVISGKYKLLRLLGEGGMGAVFEAEHQLLGNRVAIKLMHRSLVASDEAFARFLREAQACGAINHPNIVAVHDFGVDERDNIYMVMELLRGEPLAELLERRGALPVARAAAIASQILSGLHVAHAAGIIHRDLKPDNIFLAIDPRGREEVKVLDFGVAKVLAATEGNMSLTRTGTVIGTPSYLSPEQARARKNVDGRADLWSVGVMLFEMLTGERPFEGRSYNETFSRILLEEPPAVSDLAPHVSAALSAVVRRALAKEPDARFETALRMQTQLLDAVPIDESTMSSGAAKALRSSSVPPAPPVPRDAQPTVSALEGVIAQAAARPKSSPTVMEAIASDVSQLAVPRPKSRTRMVLAGAVAVAGLVFVAGLLVFRTEPEVTAEIVPMSATASSDSPPFEPVPEPPVAPAPVPAARLVMLEIKGVPSQAVVKLDGRVIEVPLRVPADALAHILVVESPMDQPFEAALMLDRDQVVEYHAEAKPRPKRRRAAVSRELAKGELLLDNPFPP